MSLAGPAAPMLVTKEDDSGAPPPPRHGGSARAREDRRTGYLLITPTVVIVFTMVVLPILWTISLGFQQVRLLNLRQAGFIGDYSLENFKNVLGSSGFVDALVTTLVYSIGGTACAIGLGLLAALALRQPFRGRGLVRACMLIPYVAPVVAATFVWKTMLNPQFGIVNHYGTTLLGLGRADRLPQLRPSRSRSSASRPHVSVALRAACSSRRGAPSPSRSSS